MNSPNDSPISSDDEYDEHEHALAASVSSIKRHSRGEHFGPPTPTSFYAQHNKSSSFFGSRHEIPQAVDEEDGDTQVEEEEEQLDTDVPGHGQMGILQVITRADGCAELILRYRSTLSMRQSVVEYWDYPLLSDQLDSMPVSP